MRADNPAIENMLMIKSGHINWGVTMTKNIQIFNVTVFVVIAVVLAVCGSKMLFFAAGSQREIAVFESDEYAHTALIRDALDKSSFDLNWTSYGHLYFNLDLIILMVVRLFTPVSDTMILVSQRIISLVSGILMVFTGYLLTKRFFGQVEALVAVPLLMFVSSDFYIWLVCSHPDTLQYFLTAVSLYFCCAYTLSVDNRDLLLASVFAGLAFSTKFSGLFLLPVIYSLLFLGMYRARLGNRLPVRFVFQAIKLSLVFFFAFIISSPYGLVEGRLIQGMIFESRHVGWGHITRNTESPLKWFSLLASNDAVGPVIAVISLVVFGAFLVRLAKNFGKKSYVVFSPQGVLWGYIILNLAYLILRVNMREVRYFVLIPFCLIILCADAIQKTVAALYKRFPSIQVRTLVFCVLMVFMASLSLPGYQRFESRWNTKNAEQITSPEIEAGNWLAESYPNDVKIYYDFYSYVPPEFVEAKFAWGGQIDEMKKYAPDIIITNDKISSRYDDPSQAENFQYGKAAYMEKYEYYKRLKNGDLGYKLIKNFGSISVFEKN